MTVLAGMLATGSAAACDRPAQAAALEAALIDWVNGQRAAKGLRMLSPSAALDKAATGHACDMAAKGYFSHTDKKGRKAKGRIKAAGYNPGYLVENLALMPKANADAVAAEWRKSAPHLKNVLNPHITEIGMAVAQGGGQYYFAFVGANPG